MRSSYEKVFDAEREAFARALEENSDLAELVAQEHASAVRAEALRAEALRAIEEAEAEVE